MSILRFLALTLLCTLITSSSSFAEYAIDAATGTADAKGETFYYDIRPLGLEGQWWSDVESPFDRLPAKAKNVVRKPVWDLSHHSAGLCVRFVTDFPAISARWTLINAELAMPHMPATGVSGVDLYVKTNDGHWRWLAAGRPAETTTTAELVSSLPRAKREYLLYLPLYNGVSSVEIGIAKGTTLFKANPRPAAKAKPIVFYGTSITQGGCAARPGTCHPALLGRQLDRPVINLGFSGNGIMEPEVAALLAELDPALYVIDCLPNMDAGGVASRAQPLVQAIRKAYPNTPILLVEDRTFPNSFLVESTRRHNADSRAALKTVFDQLIAGGDKNLAYLPGDKLLAADGDDTVDGSHPTDLGFAHQAEAMRPAMEALLKP